MSDEFVTRVLPPVEWHRLGETDFPQLLPFIGPEDIEIVVVERAGVIVGCWGVMPMVHLEGLWIHPDYRGKGSKGGVASRLLRATWAKVRAISPRWVWTAAADDRIRGLLTRQMSAIAIPGQSFMIPIHGEKRCQSLL